MQPKLDQSLSRQQTEPDTAEVIRCGVGDEIYCMEMSAIAGVRPSGDVRRATDRAPGEPMGWISHREEQIPVFELGPWLDQPPARADELNYTVLINHPAGIYGVQVESVSRVIRVRQENLLPLPKPLMPSGELFRGIVDFTRDRKAASKANPTRHLPGLSEPRETPSNRRRALHQMHLLLNTERLLPGSPSARTQAFPAERLVSRYASATFGGPLGNTRQLVTFPAGVIDDLPVLVGLSISQVVEIINPLFFVRVPRVNPEILGFVQWRNCPVPVVKLETVLGLMEDEASSMTQMLIVRDHRGAGLLALPVAERIRSLRFPIEYRLCALPRNAWKPYVSGFFEVEHGLLVLPRLEAFSPHEAGLGP